MLDEFLPDSELIRITKMGLYATKIKTSLTEPDVEVPDIPTRHKFLDTALKLKDKYPAEKRKIQGDGDNPIRYEVEIVESRKQSDE
jgi:hypothetical protein